jgi:hypothetical protein
VESPGVNVLKLRWWTGEGKPKVVGRGLRKTGMLGEKRLLDLIGTLELQLCIWPSGTAARANCMGCLCHTQRPFAASQTELAVIRI